MRIRVINPNTTWAMTDEDRGECARAVAAPGTSRSTRSARRWVRRRSRATTTRRCAVPGVLEQIAAREARGGVDGYVLACFGDPGLDAARELARGPVIGIAEAAMQSPRSSADGSASSPRWAARLGRARDLVDRYGFRDACVVGARCEVPVLDARRHRRSRARSSRRADGGRRGRRRRDRARLRGDGGAVRRIADEVGVPVIDGVAAGVVLAQSLVTLGLGPGTRGEYAPPAQADAGAGGFRDPRRRARGRSLTQGIDHLEGWMTPDLVVAPARGA